MVQNPDIKLRVEALSKKFLKQVAVEDLSLTVESGSTVLLLGANGAGKSTLLKLICGLYKPSSGSINFENIDIKHFSQLCAYLGHDHMLYKELTVRENLNFYQKIRNLKVEQDGFISEWGLGDVIDKKISLLSKGQKQKAALLNTFLHQARYVFLDEPTSNLDLNATNVLIKNIKRIASMSAGFSVIATHDTERLFEIASRVLVMEKGSLAFDSEAQAGSLDQKKKAALDYYHKVNC